MNEKILDFNKSLEENLKAVDDVFAEGEKQHISNELKKKVPIVALAELLIEKKIITNDELVLKMNKVAEELGVALD